MVNYYFELLPDVTFGGKSLKYVGDFNCQPQDLGNSSFHKFAYENSSRWWIENANGVTELRRGDAPWIQWCEQPHDPREFLWIKLRSRNIKEI